MAWVARVMGMFTEVTGLTICRTLDISALIDLRTSTSYTQLNPGIYSVMTLLIQDMLALLEV